MELIVSAEVILSTVRKWTFGAAAPSCIIVEDSTRSLDAGLSMLLELCRRTNAAASQVIEFFVDNSRMFSTRTASGFFGLVNVRGRRIAVCVI